MVVVGLGLLLVADADWLGHAFRKNAAGAWGPDLARKLSQLVKMEKNVMRSMELVARERMETAVRGFCYCVPRGRDMKSDDKRGESADLSIATTFHLG